MLKLDTKQMIVDVEQRKADELELAQFRVSRADRINNAVVVTASGNKFDADEQSISRMLNQLFAIADKPANYKLRWSLADTPTGVMSDITKADLVEAHRLAVEHMAVNWERQE